jgi:hypothetical protein
VRDASVRMRKNGSKIEHTLGRQSSFAFAALIVVLSFPFVSAAGQLNPKSARGKKVLYVYNMTKLEELRQAVPAHAIVDGSPATPQKLARIEIERNNDNKVIAFLESLGFVVTSADEKSPVETTQGTDLILISESVDAVEIGAKYRDVPIPLITFENDLLPFLEMTGHKIDVDTGTLGQHDPNGPQERFVEIVDAPHPLAAGLTAGQQNVLDDDAFKMNWGKPWPGGIVIATLRGEPEKAAIFAYEKGASMHYGFLAPARRLSFFLFSNTFEHLRPEGVALFRAALLWAVSPPGICQSG